MLDTILSGEATTVLALGLFEVIVMQDVPVEDDLLNEEFSVAWLDRCFLKRLRALEKHSAANSLDRFLRDPLD